MFFRKRFSDRILTNNSDFPTYLPREKGLLTESEIQYLSQFIGTEITITDEEPGALKKGKRITIFCYYAKSNSNGEMVWRERRHYKTNKGIDILGRTWIVSFQSDLPGHQVRQFDENWVFLAK